MKTQLITVKSKDGLELDGAFYTPDVPFQSGVRHVVSIVHGKTMNFYVGLARLLPPTLTQMGYDCLCLNRRGHGIGSLRDSFTPLGDAWTNYRQHLDDLDSGVRYLEATGYDEIILIGHSLGGYLSCTYAALNKVVRRLILASPIPYYSLSTLPYPFVPEDERNTVIRDARKTSAESKRKVYCLSGWPFLVDSETLVANLEAEKDAPLLLDSLQRLSIPVLIFYGNDPVDTMLGAPAIERKDELKQKGVELIKLKGSDHFYNGFEKQIQSIIAEWLKKTAQ